MEATMNQMTIPSFEELWDTLTATRQSFSFSDMFGTQLSVASLMRPVAAIASVLGADRGMQVVGQERHMAMEHEEAEDSEALSLSV